MNINYTPQEAIDFFKNKGYKISFDWWELWEEMHIKSFTVAKAMTLDLLADIHGLVLESIEGGLTMSEFSKQLEPKLRAKGWWGKKIMIDPKTGQAREVTTGTPWRLRTIFRTNLQSSYQCGRYRRMKRNTKTRPYWQYIAILDSVTRPSHGELHGKIVSATSSWWNLYYPPNGYNCRCTVRQLAADEIEGAGMDMVVDDDGTAYNVPARGEIADTSKIKVKPDTGWKYNPCKGYEPDKDSEKVLANVRGFDDFSRRLLS